MLVCLLFAVHIALPKSILIGSLYGAILCYRLTNFLHFVVIMPSKLPEDDVKIVATVSPSLDSPSVR